MATWPFLKKNNFLKDKFSNRSVVSALEYFFDQYYAGKNSWDGQWLLSCLQNGLCINSRTALVTNIGFDERATHTKDPNSAMANLPITGITFPLKHPTEILTNKQADDYTLSYQFVGDKNFIQKIKLMLKNFSPTTYETLKGWYTSLKT